MDSFPPPDTESQDEEPGSLFAAITPAKVLLLALASLLAYQILADVLFATGAKTLWGLLVAPLIGTILPLLLLTRRLRLSFREGLGLNGLNAGQVVACLLVSLGSLPAAYLLNVWNVQWYTPWPEFEEFMQSLVPTSPGGWTVGFLALAVAIPLAEEIIFRHLVLRVLIRGLTVPWATLLCGLLFGAAHMAPWMLLPVSFLGVVFSLMTVWTRGITAPWIAHAVFNGFAFLQLGLNQTPKTTEFDALSQLPIVLSLGLSMLILGLLWLRAVSRRNPEPG